MSTDTNITEPPILKRRCNVVGLFVLAGIFGVTLLAISKFGRNENGSNATSGTFNILGSISILLGVFGIIAFMIYTCLCKDSTLPQSSPASDNIPEIEVIMYGVENLAFDNNSTTVNRQVMCVSNNQRSLPHQLNTTQTSGSPSHLQVDKQFGLPRYELPPSYEDAVKVLPVSK